MKSISSFNSFAAVLQVLDSSEQRALKRQSVHAESGEILACKSGTDSKFLPSADDFNSGDNVAPESVRCANTDYFKL